MQALLLLLVTWTFPHQLHVVEMGLECAACHGAVETSTQSTDMLLPDPSVCQECHENSMGYQQPAQAPVLIAHFPHQAHLSQGVSCTVCHGDTAHPTLPRMATCMTCHNGDQAPNTCTICHEEHDSRFATYHPPAWLSLHGDFARTQIPSCRMCHPTTQALADPSPSPSCETCHEQENLKLQVHPKTFLYTHAEAFTTRQMDCAACHRNYQDCLSCHQQQASIPLDHLNPGWVAEGLHGTEARINPDRCLVCHGEQQNTCQRCHSGRP